MNFGDLRLIGHNIADSLAGEGGALICGSAMNIFEQAVHTPDGFIEVDFLRGTASSRPILPCLDNAIVLHRRVLPRLCDRRGGSAGEFSLLQARFSADALSKRFVVTVADHQGHRAEDEYVGSLGADIRLLDPNGRVRRQRSREMRTTRRCAAR